MRKKMATYVCLLLPAAMNVGIVFLLRLLSVADGANLRSFESAFLFNVTTARLCIAVYAVLLLGNETHKGFLKNYAGSVRSKTVCVLSKLIVLTVYAAAVFAVMTACTWLSVKILFPAAEGVKSGFFFPYLTAEWLLMTALICVISFMFSLTRSTSGSMIAAIGIVTGLFGMLLDSLVSLIAAKLELDFHYSKISLSLQINSLDPDMTAESMTNALLVGCVYIVIFGTLSCVLFKHKDIT